MNKITFVMNGKSEVTNIKENVPFHRLMQAVADGVSLCYDEQGAFLPELVDFAIEYECLAVLTDIKLGKTIESAWKYIRAIDGVPSVDADFIADGIRAVIEYRIKTTLSVMQSAGASQISQQLSEVMSTAKAFFETGNKAADAILAEAKKNQNVDFEAIAGAIKSGDLTGRDMAHAVLDYEEAKRQVMGIGTEKKLPKEPIREPVQK